MALGLGFMPASSEANPNVRLPAHSGHSGYRGHFHPGPIGNYFVQYGRPFHHGYFYPGRVHRHWSYCYWDARYRTYLYFDPCLRSYYYFCPRDTCYYPVSYCPYRTYSWGCTPAAGPVDPAVRVVTPPQVQQGFALNQGAAVPQGPQSVAPQRAGPQVPNGFKGPQPLLTPKGSPTPQGGQQPGGMLVDQNPAAAQPRIGPAPPPLSFAQGGHVGKGPTPSAPLAPPKLGVPLEETPGTIGPKTLGTTASQPAIPLEPLNPEVVLPRSPNGLNINSLNE
jgi:hypothetical protein